MSAYDRWLEQPYIDAADESDRYYDFCELHDLDPDSPEAEAAYEEFCEEVYDDLAYEDEDDDWEDDDCGW